MPIKEAPTPPTETHACLEKYLSPRKKGVRDWNVKLFPPAGTIHRCDCGRYWEMVDIEPDARRPLLHWQLRFPL